MMLFYGTPILYTETMFPEKVRWILRLNPMTHVITAYRDIFYYQKMPNMNNILFVTMISIAILLAGHRIFKHLEKGFAEEV